MPVDKSFADRIVYKHQQAENWSRYYMGCPCCGVEDDIRHPAAGRVVRFTHHGPTAPGSGCWVENYLCTACGFRFAALHRGPGLVGFREATPPNPFGASDSPG